MAHHALFHAIPPVCSSPSSLFLSDVDAGVALWISPYMGSFARAKYSPATWEMMVRCLNVNLLCVAIWEFVRVLLEVYSTEVCDFSYC